MNFLTLTEFTVELRLGFKIRKMVLRAKCLIEIKVKRKNEIQIIASYTSSLCLKLDRPDHIGMRVRNFEGKNM